MSGPLAAVTVAVSGPLGRGDVPVSGPLAAACGGGCLVCALVRGLT